MANIQRPAALDNGDAVLPPGVSPDAMWSLIDCAARGDTPGIRDLLAASAAMASVEYEGTTALHVAAREGHRGVVAALLAAGADPNRLTAHGEHLVVVARVRGYEHVAVLLEDAGAVDGSTRRREAAWRSTFAPVDYALWADPYWSRVGDMTRAKTLAGPDADLVVAAALGDLERVAALLDGGIDVNAPRPSGKRALSAAIDFGHTDVALALLQRGADPTASEGPMAPRGFALHSAARGADRFLVEALLAAGADPNAPVDSSGSATFAAATEEIRDCLVEAGGVLSPYDLVWLGEDAAAVRAIEDDPTSAHRGCGTVFAAIITLRRRELLGRVLAVGARLPACVDGCRSYLLESPVMLESVVASGSGPDIRDWQGATLLHECCVRDRRGRRRPKRLACAHMLLDWGASIDARDAALCSRPLAWAARNGVGDMVDLLLSRGSRADDPGDPRWATPLAWATRGGHTAIARTLADA